MHLRTYSKHEKFSNKVKNIGYKGLFFSSSSFAYFYPLTCSSLPLPSTSSSYSSFSRRLQDAFQVIFHFFFLFILFIFTRLHLMHCIFTKIMNEKSEPFVNVTFEIFFFPERRFSIYKWRNLKEAIFIVR